MTPKTRKPTQANANMSRRLGRALGISTRARSNLSLEKRFEIQDEFHKAERFEDLPKWVREFVYEAEAEIEIP
ncbi:hypothetical protein HL657_00860 [Methanoculleus sp. YWC-01]|uniref:Uncharacterized protein n=1 Tax=Methanoculleus nereidis TaxID=2735141 RepID=A0ABU3YYV7_9EURY|nr:hypothetical protein [Methanoculleus sp. YWC-01]MCK9297594.1 hypothetical protein [Methanoculleus sp.]MDV4341747.1 hypothetical protein [Methanoculleus sp. YWC-01]PKL56215.1 MAG: hypothetical protein CVV35_05775 [Methanomicrobiales archaeon HGW-Methanomicrobiales-6]